MRPCPRPQLVLSRAICIHHSRSLSPEFVAAAAGARGCLSSHSSQLRRASGIPCSTMRERMGVGGRATEGGGDRLGAAAPSPFRPPSSASAPAVPAVSAPIWTSASVAAGPGAPPPPGCLGRTPSRMDPKYETYLSRRDGGGERGVICGWFYFRHHLAAVTSDCSAPERSCSLRPDSCGAAGGTHLA
jgi:hypothetical protein